MDIYLGVDDARGIPSAAAGAPDAHRGMRLGDVVIRVEPSHRIRAVAEAVAGHFGLQLDPGLPLGRVGPGARSSTDGRLDEDSTVVEAGLVSGDVLILGAPAPREPESSGRTRLVVTSGPDAGRSIGLDHGTHLVGRDPACDLVLSDPQVSRRHLAIEVEPGSRPGGPSAVTLRVLAADRNEVRSGGETVVEAQPLRREQVVRLGATTLVLRDGPSAGGGRSGRRPGTDLFGQVPFHRTPYFPAPVRPVVVEPLADVPTRPEPNRFAYLSAVLPLLMGVSFAVIADNRMYLLFAAFSPIMVVGNWFDQRRRSGKAFTRAVARFEESLAARAEEVHAALADERDRRFAAAPDVAGLADRARARAADLWVRDRSAADFLELRVGVGNVAAALDVRHADRGDVEFRDQVVEAYGPTDILTDVPVTLRLAESGVVGVVGHEPDTTALASSLVLQAACLHSPEDLVIVAAAAPFRGLATWLKWLPHTRSTSSPLAGPELVDTRERADALIVELVAEAGRRLDGATSSGSRFPHLLVLLDRSLEPDPALVSRLLDAGPGAGFSVVWLTDRPERVPRQARAVVDCRASSTGELSRITWTDPEVADQLIDPDLVGAELALQTARALAPVRDASSANAVTAIPRIVPLFTALGVEAVDADLIARWWKIDRGYSLQGPIGHTESGPLILDLVEHGPHGLIGGTSGAGKSELVMSLVAGLIANNPPSRVNFLFIDYKGGASSDLFRDVPHTVGYVTNLDGLLAMRALTSLRAELNRRMNLLQGRAKDLAEMIERHPDEAPPSLVIVVDEFATLVKEIPDFVAGMVDIAQRGRSLGIHLLLATQRPSGSVNDNIKANTNLRISLRMLDGGESTAVIGAPDAAAIPTPLKGRGYARLGAGELVAFQSAWSGAPLLAESGTPPVSVATFGGGSPSVGGPTMGGRAGSTAPTSSGPAPDRTQIDALLEAAVGAARSLGHERGRAPWLEVLPSVVPLETVRSALTARAGDGALGDGDLGDGVLGDGAPGSRVVLGMIDDPAAQAQYPAIVDLARSGGLLIGGTGGSGKSTALITAAVSAAMDDADAGGGRLTIFALDFASRELVGLNRLPQCAAVATGDDLEAVTRIIDRLDQEFEHRRSALADAVARSEAPPREAKVLLLIDGMDALIQTMEQGAAAVGLTLHLQALTRLVVEGRQVGIHPIIATSRLGAIRAGISSAISSRLVLRQADASGYAEAGIPASQARDLDLDPGQGFLNGTTLVQVACLADAGEERNRERLVAIAERLVGSVHPRLVTAPLPRRVLLADVPVGDGNDPLRPVVGLADLTNRPYALDLRHANLSIVGDPRTGRSSVLAAIGRRAAAAGAELWVLASAASPLGALDEADRRCLAEGEERSAFLEELAAMAEAKTAPGAKTVADRPRLLLIDDHDLLPENDRSVTAPLERLFGSVRWVAAGAKPRGFSTNPVAQLVRAARSMVYLRPHDAREAHEVVGIPVPWHPGLAMVEGRGLAVVDRMPTIVQFADPFGDAPGR